MHRHHDDRIGLCVILLDIRIERYFLQKAGERRHVGIFAVAHNARFELSDIFEPAARFHIVFSFQHRDISGADQKLFVKVRQTERLEKLGAVLDEDRKRHQLRRRFLEARIAIGIGDDGIKGHTRRFRLPGGHFDGLCADAARRIVDDAKKPEIVRAVVDHAQIRQHVFYLRAVKKARAADDAIWNAVALEGVFQRVRLRVCTVQNREILEVPPLRDRENTPRDVVCLVRFIHRLIDSDLIAGVVFRPEFLALASLIVGDDGVRRIENRLRRAVVLLEADDLRAAVLLFKRQNIFNRRAAEFVDGLVVVTHDADVFISARKKRRKPVLKLVRVLILVDEHIAELALVIGSHVLERVQELHGLENDIVKVQRVCVMEPLLIALIDLRDFLHAVVPRAVGNLGERVRMLRLVLGLADHGQAQPRRKRLFIHVQFFQNILDDAFRVRRVVDRKARGIALEPVDIAS